MELKFNPNKNILIAFTRIKLNPIPIVAAERTLESKPEVKSLGLFLDIKLSFMDTGTIVWENRASLTNRGKTHLED